MIETGDRNDTSPLVVASTPSSPLAPRLVLDFGRVPPAPAAPTRAPPACCSDPVLVVRTNSCTQ
eukprot:6988814-Pyramimonas_sp.AAC.1